MNVTAVHAQYLVFAPPYPTISHGAPGIITMPCTKPGFVLKE